MPRRLRSLLDLPVARPAPIRRRRPAPKADVRTALGLLAVGAVGLAVIVAQLAIAWSSWWWTRQAAGP